jgi:hypothetical protein
MLIAARSCQDFAFCSRATASARLKYASDLAASGSGVLSATMGFRLAPFLLGCFPCRHRIANTASSIIELTEFRIL